MNSRLNHIAERLSSTGQRRDAMGRRHGSVAVMAAIFLSIVIILFSSIDIGYMFYMKRNLQKAADLAALAGAQQLVSTPLNGNPTACGATDGPVLAAIGNARTNGFSTAAPNTMANAITVTCGRWDPIANAALAPSYFAPPVAGAVLNSVRVALTQNVPTFFGLGTRTLSAQAIGSASDPYAAFSVGSKLLQINGGIVPGLLSAVGLNLNGTSALSYSGLANVVVTPNGLLKALGFEIPLHADVLTLTNILQANTAGCSNGACTLQALLGAITTVGGQQNLISALGLTVQQLNLTIPLLSGSTGRGGLFTVISAADTQSALNVNLSALDILSTAIGVANSHRGVDAGINVGSVVTTKIGIVEPPSIAIGGVGTQAFTSQVRLYTRIKANLTVPLVAAVTVDLPIIIDVVNGLGTLKQMCVAKDPGTGKDLATIDVQAPVLSLCAGKFNGTVDGSTAYSTNGACSTNLADYPMINVNVLGGNLLSVSKAIAINALPNSPNLITLYKGQTQSIKYNNLQIGTTVTNLLTSLLGSLSGSLGGLLGALLGGVLTGLVNLLQPILDLLGSALATLLNSVLGVGLGLVDVKLIDLNCGGATVKLVF
jgi:uncharacterized membrane protein